MDELPTRISERVESMEDESFGGVPISRKEFLSGVRDELPLMIGVAPFGLVFGVLGLASGLTALQTILMSSIIFAGASQVIFVQMWSTGVPAPIIGASVSVVNLRHSLYSASVAPYLQGLSVRWRLLLAYLLTDEAYAVSINRFREGGDSKFQHYYLLGAGITLWTTWQLSTLIGVLFGATVPEAWSLEFVIPLTFIALVVPAIEKRSDVAACVVAAVISILAQPLPWKSWIMLATICGIITGYSVSLLESREVNE
jgi:4-azaleucine resistance transporter AzlC|tara:strand:- start:604 stop:1371 length:768 start_codon:yes stop_codon:yes gene_type:complete